MQVVDQNRNATLNEYMNASHMRKVKLKFVTN